MIYCTAIGRRQCGPGMGQTHRSVGQYRESENRGHKYSPVILTKVQRQFSREMTVFSTSDIRTGIHMPKKKKNEPQTLNVTRKLTQKGSQI